MKGTVAFCWLVIFIIFVTILNELAKKNKNANDNLLTYIIILVLFFSAPFAWWIISTPSPLGFIEPQHQEAWLGFFGSIIGGALTIFGVWWTIVDQDKKREKDKTDQQNEFNQTLQAFTELAKEMKNQNNLLSQQLAQSKKELDENKSQFSQKMHQHNLERNFDIQHLINEKKEEIHMKVQPLLVITKILHNEHFGRTNEHLNIGLNFVMKNVGRGPLTHFCHTRNDRFVIYKNKKYMVEQDTGFFDKDDINNIILEVNKEQTVAVINFPITLDTPDENFEGTFYAKYCFKDIYGKDLCQFFKAVITSEANKGLGRQDWIDFSNPIIIEESEYEESSKGKEVEWLSNP